MGNQLPLPQRGTAPNFRPMSVVAKRLDGLRCYLVWRQDSAQATLCSMGTQLPPEKRHTQPHPFLAHVYCGQTAGWIGLKTPLVLDGVPALRERGTAATLFSAHVYCSHGRPSQLLLSSCLKFDDAGRRGHSKKLFNRRSRLDIRYI